MGGLLVTIEGGEAAGKTTQIRRLAESLVRNGSDVLSTREPGGAPGAEALRGFVLERDHGLSLRAEATVHVAARLDHVERTIRPALDAGRVVLCDRFSDSTLAYQGYGLGYGDPGLLGFIDGLNRLVEMQPHLTLVLDVPLEIARSRMVQRGPGRDRYETLGDDFHARVADGFRTIARDAPERCRLIEAGGTINDVHGAMLAAVLRLLAT